MSNILETFRNWFERHETVLKERDLEFSLSDPSIQDGQWVDMDAIGHIGRITLWGSGECDLEVIERKSGDRLLWENTVLRSLEEMESAFQRFIEKLLQL